MIFSNMKFKECIRYLLLSCVILISLISIIATGGGDDGEGTGTLSISMTDSVMYDLAEVWVTIEEVSVHTSVDEQNAGEEQNNGENQEEETGSWEVIEGDGIPGEYDLLKLVNGVLQGLGEVKLEAGHYTQIRLLLGEKNYVVTKDNPAQELDLQISSQDETGIKLTKGFDIESGVVTELLLDWNMDRSIMEMPNGEYKLKPTIKIIGVEVASTISGIVTKDDEEVITGAKVTAQVVDSEGNLVSVGSSTTTDGNGEYKLILEELEEGSNYNYNIVVYFEGYSPQCKTIYYDELVPPTNITDGNFTLYPVNTGTISGNVTITDPEPDQSVDISIRQSSDCGEIEIDYYNVASGGQYSATLPELPEGSYYTLVASTEGYDTQIHDVTIDSENPATKDLVFN